MNPTHTEINRLQRTLFNNYLGKEMYKYKIMHMIIHRCSGSTGLLKHLQDLERKQPEGFYKPLPTIVNKYC